MKHFFVGRYQLFQHKDILLLETTKNMASEKSSLVH